MKYARCLRYGFLFVVCLWVVTFGKVSDRGLASASIAVNHEAVIHETVTQEAITREAIRSEVINNLEEPIERAPTYTKIELAQATERPIAPTGDFVRDTLAAPVICPARLGVLIDNIIDQSPAAAGRWGVIAESPLASEPIYSRNAEDFFIPASNIKLLTTAAALQLLDVNTPNSRLSLESRMRIINGNSDNPSADALLAQIGGTRAVQDTLLQLGIDPAGYRQVDGSGLSRNNIAQPKMFVNLLKAMRSANGSDIFYNSLPVGGSTGTLRNRFRGTPIAGKVRAKTGTLNGVRALSGYLEHPEHGEITFSIVVNQPGQSGAVLLQTIDQIVLQLARVSVCE